MPYRWANACAMSSPARLLAAYGEIGQTAAASSANGAGVASPYTDPDDLVAPPDERFAHVGADEPCGPGHQDPQAHLQTSVRKYSMVCPSPWSRETWGSQPRVARARAMSGWRTFGSSTWSGRSTIGLRLPLRR